MTRLLLFLLASGVLAAQSPAKIISGKRYPRLIIRNAIVIEGNGTPAAGPKDIVIENNLISDIVPLDPVAAARGEARRPKGDVEIDAAGKYVMPGLINAHGHVQDERGGIPQPVEYEPQTVALLRHHHRPRCRQRHEENPAASQTERRG